MNNDDREEFEKAWKNLVTFPEFDLIGGGRYRPVIIEYGYQGWQAACKQDAETIKRLTRDRDELLAALQNVPYLCLENHNLITRIEKEKLE